MYQSYRNNPALYTVFFLLALLLSPFAHSSVIMGHKHEAYLFVQSAKKVTIKANTRNNTHKNHVKTYTITLEKTDPLITYFSDRPIRNAGEMKLLEFMKLWYHQDTNSFEKNPPNAVLHVKKTRLFSEDEVYDYALELSAPHYNEKTRTLTFTAKILPGNVDKIADSAVFDHVSLFIDSVCLTCWGGK